MARYRQPAKFTKGDGATIKTKTVRIPEYLCSEVEAYARRLHEERMGRQ